MQGHKGNRGQSAWRVGITLSQKGRDLVGLDREALPGVFEIPVCLPEKTRDLLAHATIVIGQPRGKWAWGSLAAIALPPVS